MIDIEKGRYWDEGIKLVSSCTRCSPGCDHCWSLAMEKRFNGNNNKKIGRGIWLHPERLSRFNTRKPKVFAIWNDLFHEFVPDDFKDQVYTAMVRAKQHTFLILTKRPQIMADYMAGCQRGADEIGGKFPWESIWHGLTICNQKEADEKIPVFLQVPGKKFLSIEPMLGKVDLLFVFDKCMPCNMQPGYWFRNRINAVLLGGETGPGARPMHPDWVRSVRDQCAAAGVPFFFKQWGSQIPFSTADGRQIVPWGDYNPKIGGKCGWYLKGKSRLLDGRTHDDLPWIRTPH